VPEIEAEPEFAWYWICGMWTDYDEVLGWCRKHLPKDSWAELPRNLRTVKIYSEKAYCWFTLRWGE
jgi:hypothetical protein